MSNRYIVNQVRAYVHTYYYTKESIHSVYKFKAGKVNRYTFEYIYGELQRYTGDRMYSNTLAHLESWRRIIH